MLVPAELNSSHSVRFGGCSFTVYIFLSGLRLGRWATPDSKWESVCPQVSLTSLEAISWAAWPELTVCKFRCFLANSGLFLLQTLSMEKLI